MKKIKLKKFDIYISIIVLLIIFVSLNIGFERALLVDFWPINGDFQNYNVWRRLLDGQTPYKDFPVYLGSGHLILGGIVNMIFGNTFKMSLVTSYFLTVLLSASIITIVLYLIINNIKASLSITLLLIIILREKFEWVQNFIYSEFLDGFDSIFSPGNSARVIRSGVVFFTILGVLILTRLAQKRFTDANKRFFFNITCYSIIAGAGIVYSNDVGVSSYISFSFIYFVMLIIYFRSILKVIKYTFYYIAVSLLSMLTVIAIITRGHIVSWFKFTISVSDYQNWYFGLTEGWKSYYIYHLTFTPLIIMSLLIMLISFIRIIRGYKSESFNFIISNCLVIYVVLTFFISSNMYRIISGGISQELLSISTFTIIMGYIYLALTKIINTSKTEFKIHVKCFVLFVCISFTTPRIITTFLKYTTYDTYGIYMDGLDGYLSSLGDDINTIVQYTGDDEIFSTYASAVEVIKKDFQPTGTDYIIHVLGDDAREEYLKKFQEGHFKYVQTINRDYTVWELWIEGSNWFFYKELYKDYNPTLFTSYSVLWEPSNTQNIIDTKTSISIEKVSSSEYKIICNADKPVNGIADVYINYHSEFENGFLHNGVYGRQVHVTDITRKELYNNDEYVNYFIPQSKDRYNIPITLVDGKGEVVIRSYPQAETYLKLYDVDVECVIKDHFNNFTLENLTDDNWVKGVSVYSNTLLFKNTLHNRSLLEEAKQLMSQGVYADIINIEQTDEWINVTVSGNKEFFSYPNKIQTIK